MRRGQIAAEFIRFLKRPLRAGGLAGDVVKRPD